jgi:hypothetical protein
MQHIGGGRGECKEPWLRSGGGGARQPVWETWSWLDDDERTAHLPCSNLDEQRARMGSTREGVRSGDRERRFGARDEVVRQPWCLET